MDKEHGRSGFAVGPAPFGLSPFGSQAEPLVPNASPTLIALEESVKAGIVEDVSHIVRCAPFIARYPARLFDPSLASELAEAVDILACKVADLKEAEDAGR